MHFSKKHTLIPLTLIIICIVFRGFFLYSMRVYPLANFCQALAMELLTDNPLELHYSIAYPEKLGLENLSNNLTAFQTDYYLEGRTHWENKLQEFAGIIPAKSNARDTFLYQLLGRYLELQVESFDYPYYENPLACSGGVHSQLPILLSEYAFRSLEDIENYFVLLSQIPEYLNGLALYAQNQEINGIYLYKGGLEKVAAQCLELFPQTQLEAGEHLLQTSFKARLEDLSQNQQALTEKELSDYAARNDALLKNTIAPAYTKLAAAIGALTGSDTLSGLSSYPKGQDYYAFLLEANTGSARSVEEIKSMLFKRYDSLYRELQNLLSQADFPEDEEFPLTSHREMLSQLHQCSQEDFPALSQNDLETSCRVQLKNVHSALASMSAPAFYMTPPLDDNNSHTIYINPDAQMDGLELYTTLAHEGFPGHLYQTVYSQNALTKENAPLLRHLLYYGGFTEGWAVYAELYSYDYAAKVWGEAYTAQILLERCQREIQLCLCCILDIYIHYDGASLKQVESLLGKLGLQPENALSVYEAICDSPANYPKYYVGYLEILDLRETAQNLWKETYSDYKFHQWLLETGGGDFGSLKRLLADS